MTEAKDQRFLARATFGSSHYYPEIRKGCVQYLLKHKDRLLGHIEDVHEYSSNMLNDGTWFGEPELRAFSELMAVKI